MRCVAFQETAHSLLQCVMISTHCDRHQHTATDCMQCCTQSLAVCYDINTLQQIHTATDCTQSGAVCHDINTTLLQCVYSLAVCHDINTLQQTSTHCNRLYAVLHTICCSVLSCLLCLFIEDYMENAKNYGIFECY